MMGHRGTISGGEVDTLTPARRLYHWKAGTRAWWKRQFNKRMRATPPAWCDGIPDDADDEVLLALLEEGKS